ncbi:DNA/RNA non-specific endonuclease [Flavobacterium muglaense]|uniref:DNA/RNA non-specific endonuclease n=1 Tax=Flavobacterium muglaense TaxID=2764716 RepID=A0A923MXI2_9FLAO|nr:DNA/RNA non-specific endonuclease [Flavobacterium muglaense]MBC5836862.1 DNA/RNA non-specific endonuclease [Flavobacterium muglaense]MBC5843391.1 DNA/RNA non-specific endonuclease [Flavobacterium muglaense]
MKNITLKTVLLIIIGLSLSCKMDDKGVNGVVEQLNGQEQIIGRDVNKTGSNAVDFDYLPSSTTGQIVKHSYYTLSYKEEAEQAEWLAYELKKEYVKNSDFKRPYFNVDPKVKTGSADWRNYKQSGYDKGHLCPAADMEFSKEAYTDTFFTSNISPQNHDFNGGIWNRLEQKVRYWASRYDGVYVVTGGVLNKTYKSIGTEKVVVPEYFYKIILDEYNGKYKMIAFLIPNKKSNEPLYTYVVSVDSLEQMTGVDFFPQLEDQLETTLEKQKDIKSWVFN